MAGKLRKLKAKRRHSSVLIRIKSFKFLKLYCYFFAKLLQFKKKKRVLGFYFHPFARFFRLKIIFVEDLFVLYTLLFEEDHGYDDERC